MTNAVLVGLHFAAAPFGAVVITLAADALLVVPNLGEPATFFERASDWTDVRGSVGYTHDGIEAKLGDFDKYWGGPAADAFNSYMKDTFLPALEPLKELATTMAEASGEMGWTCVMFMIAVITATITATLAMIAANAEAVATLGIGAPACYVVAGIFLTALITIVMFIVDHLQGLYGQVQALKQSIQDQAGKIFTNARELEGNALALSDAVTNKKGSYVPDSTPEDK